MPDHTEAACVFLVAAALFAIPALSDAPANPGMTYDEMIRSLCYAPVETVTLSADEVAAYTRSPAGTLNSPRLSEDGWEVDKATFIVGTGKSGTPEEPDVGTPPEPEPDPAPIPVPPTWLLLASGLLFGWLVRRIGYPAIFRRMRG